MLQAGSLTTTFTASQGLLLMIPNMYKIAGELLPFCMHVTARSLATHALSIFGDHSDVMACRQTGFAMLCSNNVQECQDMAAVAHATAIKSRVPFMHFFDGFRTSHEINTLKPLPNEQLRELIDMESVRAFRQRALTPDAPSVRGTAQNPDVFFQAREAANPFYATLPDFLKESLAKFAELTGRSYAPFEYEGAEDAEQVIVSMGSSCETISETVHYLNSKGARVGLIKVRLYRPFLYEDFCAVVPRSVRSIAVLDRTKEPGAMADPLYLDVVAALEEGRATGILPDAVSPRIIGGRYGLGSKEFTPAMVKAVFDELLKQQPKRRFTVGIVDDVMGNSLEVDGAFTLEEKGVYGAVFYGLGSDGTVGANKNTIKIIGTETDQFAQGYFVYDSKKSGAMTVSHLRFGPEPIRAPYLVSNARFVGCHQFSFLDRYDVLEFAGRGAVFLVNSTFGADRVWDHLPRSAQRDIIEKGLKMYTIDAYKVARETGMGARINTIMQTAFFAISGVLPADEAIAKIKEAIEKTYSKKGRGIVEKNFAAVDTALAHLQQVEVPTAVSSSYDRHPAITGDAPDFVKKVTAVMLENKGDLLPVSAFPVDGVWPTGTTKYEKRNIAQEIPVWESDLCIQCNKCVFVCPHAAIRAKFYPEETVVHAPDAFKTVPFRSKEYPDHLFTIQVAP
jgi:pyruvate-ferredoxin/flavodoxin oxidoreductase